MTRSLDRCKKKASLIDRRSSQLFSIRCVVGEGAAIGEFFPEPSEFDAGDEEPEEGRGDSEVHFEDLEAQTVQLDSVKSG